jgi:ketosteroid isomerase-like protein
MSQENVEVVRRTLELWNQDDWEALAACYDPQVVTIAPRGWPEASDRRGWEETREQFERLKDSWSMERTEVDEIRDLGEDRVLARFRWLVSGRTSGIPAETPFTSLSTLREGKIIRIEFFLDHAEALEAAGLSE